MSRRLTIGEAVIDQFPVWDWDNVTKVAGQASFTTNLWHNGVLSAVAVTVSEIGSTGEYTASFTPDATGFWLLEVKIHYNNEVWFGKYDVDAVQVDIQASMADDSSNATFAVWLERNGERLTDIESISATVKDSDDVEVYDFGTNSAPTSDGVFKFQVASAALTPHVPYLIAATATRGAETWSANLGFAKA